MRRNGRTWGIGHGASGNGSPAFTIVLVAAVVCAALLGGCPQRQEIIEQTVGAKARDVASEAEAGYVAEDLQTWEMVQEIDPGFDEARTLAYGPDDALYVGGDEAVRKIAADGTVEWEMAVGGEPYCLTIDTDGTIVVGMRSKIEIRDGAGQLVNSLELTDSRTWLTSLATAPGAIFAADAGNRRVLRFDTAGQMTVFVAKDEARGLPALSIPSPHLDVAAIAGEAASGGSPTELVVVNPGKHTIQYHAIQDGALLRTWRKSSNSVEGFGGCCNPTDIAVLPDGRVATSEKGIPRVKVYSSEGELLSVVVPPEDFRTGASGIDLAADSSGRVAVLDPDRGIVRLYEEKSGEQETVQE